MSENAPNQQRGTVLKRYPALAQYGGAVLAVWVALSLWTLFPILHRQPFALFLTAVVMTARFFGLGPALVCSALSTACLDFVVFSPRYSFALSTADDVERLAVFLALAVLVGSLARQKTQAELRAERTMREMAAIVECSDDAIFSTSPDGIITGWNRGAERLYGYSAEEAVGAPVLLLAPPERHEEAEQNRQVLNRGGSVESYQTERMRKDGTRVPLLLTVSPLRNAQGKIVGASATARDISAQRHSEEAVRRSEKLATAGRLAASIAHEINNPLEAVLNLLYLARNDPRKAEQYLSMAEQEVGRVARLAQQTLGFVRDTSSPGRMDPAAIMDEILELYSRKLEDKKIRVTRRYRGSSQISGYSGELRQLLANLLVNAVDAMDEGGSLRVRVTAGHQWSGGRVGIRLTVADNGSGIPREGLRRIFEPFYTTKEDAGTGLGLWVSRGIVEKHGGSIRVRSRSEGRHRGTVFSIFLPSAYAASLVA
ncbi:MAG: PAS domain S-box protein [Acidobacteriales bacterium]|nr:PAS domain S-box protein [Terriglobales bacterium]